MATSMVVRKGLITASDMAFGTGTIAQSRRRNGTVVATAYERVNTGHIPLSADLQAITAFAGITMLDGAVSLIAAGGAIPIATTLIKGIGAVSVAPVLPTLPIFVGDNDTRNLTIAQADGVRAAANAMTATNPAWTLLDARNAAMINQGSGCDGHGQLGAIVASATAPTIISVATTGRLTGSFTYKSAQYNLSGSIVATSASVSTGAITAKQVSVGLNALLSGSMGHLVFRSGDGITWYQVGKTVGSTTFVDNNDTPNTTVAPAADTTGATATISGIYHFTDFTLTAGQTITIANSGNWAGLLHIYHTGTFTPGGTIIGTGAHRILFNRHVMGQIGSTIAGTTATSRDAGTFNGTLGNYVTTSTVIAGFGAAWHNSLKMWQGFGSEGRSVGVSTKGDGGYAGGSLLISGNQIAAGVLTGTYTLSGDNGTNAVLNGGTGAQGGGGGGGGVQWFVSANSFKTTATHTCNGGNGGTGVSDGGGGFAIVGAGGGGGGFVGFAAPNGVDSAGATISAAAGTSAANVASSSQDHGIGGGGGASAGNGAANGGTPSAGQTIKLVGDYAPKMWGLAA